MVLKSLITPSKKQRGQQQKIIKRTRSLLKNTHWLPQETNNPILHFFSLSLNLHQSLSLLPSSSLRHLTKASTLTSIFLLRHWRRTTEWQRRRRVFPSFSGDFLGWFHLFLFFLMFTGVWEREEKMFLLLFPVEKSEAWICRNKKFLLHEEAAKRSTLTIFVNLDQIPSFLFPLGLHTWTGFHLPTYSYLAILQNLPLLPPK